MCNIKRRGVIMIENNVVDRISSNINKVFKGKNEVIRLSLIVLLAEGHLLLEDVPGVGKTTLAKAIAKSIGCSFSRIQFTPDTLPSDVTGCSVYNMKTGTFDFMKGSVMNNIVLADEINRTSPKTQASLLEVMQERQVTVDSDTYILERPFMVIATQNPSDFLGTYILPEAQLDRFMIRLSIGYPTFSEESNMTSDFIKGLNSQDITPVVTKEEIIELQDKVRNIYICNDIHNYAVSITSATRNNDKISLGASPRATIALLRASQACAFINGRDYVIPDDIQYLAKYVLCHRLVLSTSAKIDNNTAELLVERIISKTKVPVIENEGKQ